MPTKKEIISNDIRYPLRSFWDFIFCTGWVVLCLFFRDVIVVVFEGVDTFFLLVIFIYILFSFNEKISRSAAIGWSALVGLSIMAAQKGIYVLPSF
jgi:hypothetical protein